MVEAADPHDAAIEDDQTEDDQTIDAARLLRASGALQKTLEELRSLDVDGDGSEIAAQAYNSSLQEIRSQVPRDLTGELDDVALPIAGDASFEEIRLGHARLVGWLQGMFQGMQASMMIEQAQQRQRPQPTLEMPVTDRSTTYL